MAVKKKSLTKAKKSSSKALMTQAQVDAMYAAQAAEESERIRSGGGNRISIRGEEFSLRGASLGEELEVVILGWRYENQWYGGLPYDPQNPTIPSCYAIGELDTSMAPHKDVPEKQSDSCQGCELNEWGSAERGRAKACKNGRKVAIVAAADLGSSPEDIEIVILNIPPTSLKNFDKFVKGLNKVVKRPAHGVITKVFFDADAAHEVLKFCVVDKVGMDVVDVIETKREEATDILDQGYDATGYVRIEDRATFKKKAVKGATAKKKGRFSK